MKYRPDIDGLRTVAVLPVVAYHSGLGLPGGFVGVDVFFVISGFLITSILISETDLSDRTILQFYERRIRRIFPALFAMILATTIAASLIMLPFDFADFGKSVFSATLFAANIWFYRQEGYFTEAAELEPLLHTWSLGVEEQFYIVFPLVLLFALRLLGHRGAVALLGLVAVVSFAASVTSLPTDPVGVFYLAHFRVWELLLGAVLAFMMARRWWRSCWMPLWLCHTVSILALFAICLPVAFYGPETAFPGLAALPPCLGAVVLIATGSDGRSLGARLLSMPVMTYIGKLSYSLYLWHWPVIALVYYRTGPLSVGVGLACLALSFGLAVLSWRFIEHPFRDPRRVRRQTVAVGALAAVMLTAGMGVAIWRNDGFPNRVDPKIIALADYRNYVHDRRECHSVTPARARDGHVCVRGAADSAPRFVLAGDSHADAFSPALFAAAKELGLAGYQYTHAGFVPLPGVWRRGQDAGQSGVEAFVTFLEERPDIETVIITRFWLLQMTGYSYRHKSQIWLDAGYDGSGTGYNVTATRNGLIRLAQHFPDRQILLLDDVPTGLGLHVRDHLRRTRDGDITDRGLAAQTFHAQRALYEPVLKALAEDIPNIHYHPVFEGLCDSTLCPLFEGDTLLYRDGDHLSFAGALRLQDTARDVLQRLANTGQF